MNLEKLKEALSKARASYARKSAGIEPSCHGELGRLSREISMLEGRIAKAWAHANSNAKSADLARDD